MRKTKGREKRVIIKKKSKRENQKKNLKKKNKDN